MHIDEDTHLPSDKQKEKSVPQEKRAPIKLSLFDNHLWPSAKTKPAGHVSLSNNIYNVKKRTPITKRQFPTSQTLA
jgi:hypothetical protein